MIASCLHVAADSDNLCRFNHADRNQANQADLGELESIFRAHLDSQLKILKVKILKAYWALNRPIIEMRWGWTCGVLAVALGWPALGRPGLQLVDGWESPPVFAGAARNITLTFSNGSDTNFASDIRRRMFQTTSATAVGLGDRPWKRLALLPRQVILESAEVDFPAVNGATEFLLQWHTGANDIVGETEILVYPTNLLAELKTMTADAGLGVWDPQNQLKPALGNLKVDFTDLAESGLDSFAGKLAIIGPFESRTQMGNSLTARIKALAKRNVAVVWLLPPPEKADKPVPSFYTVLENTNAVVVVQADWVARLADNPQAQSNLIYFCKLALKPEPPGLPDFSNQPWK